MAVITLDPVSPAVVAALSLIEAVVRYQTVLLERATPETAERIAAANAETLERWLKLFEPLFKPFNKEPV